MIEMNKYLGNHKEKHEIKRNQSVKSVPEKSRDLKFDITAESVAEGSRYIQPYWNP